MVEIPRATGGRFAKKSSGEPTATTNDAGIAPESNINDATIVNPAEITGAGNGASEPEPTPKRGRGRPKGSGSFQGETKTKTPFHLDGLSSILLSVHAMLAGITKTPEIALDEKESKQIADAAAKVAAHYDIGMTEKQQAWVNLTFVAGGIYGAKFFAYNIRIKEMKRAKQPAPVSQPIPGMPDITHAILP